MEVSHSTSLDERLRYLGNMIHLVSSIPFIEPFKTDTFIEALKGITYKIEYGMKEDVKISGESGLIKYSEFAEVLSEKRNVGFKKDGGFSYLPYSSIKERIISRLDSSLSEEIVEGFFENERKILVNSFYVNMLDSIKTLEDISLRAEILEESFDYTSFSLQMHGFDIRHPTLQVYDMEIFVKKKKMKKELIYVSPDGKEVIDKSVETKVRDLFGVKSEDIFVLLNSYDGFDVRKVKRYSIGPFYSSLVHPEDAKKQDQNSEMICKALYRDQGSIADGNVLHVLEDESLKYFNPHDRESMNKPRVTSKDHYVYYEKETYDRLSQSIRSATHTVVEMKDGDIHG